MAWIHLIDEQDANEYLKKVYDKIKLKRGKLSNIMKVHSLNPEAMKNHMSLYLSIMFGKSNLKREDRELIAVIVSSINKCKYCVNHHAQALEFYWKDNEKVKSLIENPRYIDLSDKKKKMINYVLKLTNSPYKIKKEELDKLRNVGYTDKDILDINLIASYFNFVNRIALGLGVKFSEDEIKGYKY